MAAAEYYNDSNRYNAAPVSPVGSPAPPGPGAPPHQTNPFSHPSAGYNDDLSYAQHHYSQHSIDTAYHSHSDSPTKYPAPTDPFSDNIPLHDTGHKPPHLPAAEAGGLPPLHPPGRRPSRRRHHTVPAQRQRRPWFVYFITCIQVAVFCVQLARNTQLQGTPIATKPSFNPMIGPSTDVMVSMGARFVPCMRVVESFMNTDPNQLYPCPNRTTDLLECPLSTWCGFNGDNIPSDLPGGKGPHGSTPNQWYRFILPMFYHAGLIHLFFNMFIQVWLGGECERDIGMLRFMVVYFASGIFGFVLGANLGSLGQPVVGASGSLFGIFALSMLDILYTWPDRPRPGRDLTYLLIDIVISFVLGLLPGIDNFSHIGGFLAGIAIGLTVMRSPNQLRQKIGSIDSDPPYTFATSSNPYNSSSGDNNLYGFQGFTKQPLAFFKGRKPLWWAWWLVRASMLAIVVIVFSVLLHNFYLPQMKRCSWCKYLSCLPVNGWCDMYNGLGVKNITLPANTTSQPARLMARALGEFL